MTEKTTPPSSNVTPMTNSAAARIQSAIAKNSGGVITKESFAARAQRAAANNSKK